jgi:hypothetical protein
MTSDLLPLGCRDSFNLVDIYSTDGTSSYSPSQVLEPRVLSYWSGGSVNMAISGSSW